MVRKRLGPAALAFLLHAGGTTAWASPDAPIPDAPEEPTGEDAPEEPTGEDAPEEPTSPVPVAPASPDPVAPAGESGPDAPEAGAEEPAGDGGPEQPAPAPPADGPFVPPRPLDTPSLRYPEGVDAGDQVVELLLTIDERGEVVEVVVQSGVEPFTTLVEEAARGLRFEPAREGGAPVAVEMPFRWEFAAPRVNVRGVLRANGDRRPLSDVRLRIGDRVVLTDEEGTFELRNVDPGEHAVKVDAAGLWMPETTFTLGEDEEVALTLYATRADARNEAVAVYRATRDPVARRTTLSREEARLVPGSMGDPLRAIQNHPGLVRTPLEAGWLLIRGGEPDETAISLEGVPIPLAYHLGGFTSVVHPEMVEEVGLYAGTWPARFGPALAGVVDVRTRKLEDDTRIVAGVDLVNTHVFAQVPLGGDVRVAAAARRSYLDGVLALILDPERAKIAPRFWDGQLLLQTPRGSLFVLGMLDQVDIPASLGGDTLTVTETALQVQGRYHVPLPEGDLELQPWIARQARDLETDSRDLHERHLLPGLRLEWRSEEERIWRLSSGVVGEQRWYSAEMSGSSRSAPLTTVDPYAELTVGEDLQVRGAVRGHGLLVRDHLPRVAASYQGGVAWRPHPHWTLLLEGGRFHQRPPLFFLIGTPDGPYLHWERSEAGSVGVRWDRAESSAAVTGWWRHSENLVAFEDDNTVGQFEAVARGVEVSGRHRLNKTELRVVYQVGTSLRREDPGDLFAPYRYDQPHRLLLLATQALPRDWSLSSRFRYGTGYPLVGSKDEAYDVLNQTEVDIRANDRGRLPPYHALDLKIARRFTWRWGHADAYLDLWNVYSRRVPEPAINGIDDSDPAYGFGMPLLPVFGVEGSFWP